jgi:hypothetical protein
LDVCNSGTLILEGEPEAAADAIRDDFDQDLAPTAVLNRIARELAGSGDDFRLVDEAEPYFDRALPNALSDDDDVFRGRER